MECDFCQMQCDSPEFLREHIKLTHTQRAREEEVVDAVTPRGRLKGSTAQKNKVCLLVSYSFVVSSHGHYTAKKDQQIRVKE